MKQQTPQEWKQYFETEQFDEAYYYEGADLGYTLQEDGILFKVWAPTAENVVLNLYKSGNVWMQDRLQEIPMQKSEKGTWIVQVPGGQKNCYYTFTVTANGETKETQDVYSRACGVNGKRSMAVDLADTDPEGWQEDAYSYDSSCLPVIYELHIKDFSFAESSGIPKKYRGKYKAFTITDSTLNGKGEKPTCLAYLKELGITHVHLLPAFDFASVDETGDFDTQFNWGYDPVNYNVPEGSYATDAADGRIRIREFKEMVQSLHRAGLGVIMDVVYNHTYSLDSCFQKTVPYYYYREDEQGVLSNGSICGNDTASERKMYRKYMVDSVCYWAKEYHIDGFRFDLMGLHDVETMNEIRRNLDKLPGGKDILMYGEPWAGSATAMKEGSIPALKRNVELLDKGIAIFNDDTRDAIKGSVFYEEHPGYINGKTGLTDEIRSSVCAWCDGGHDYIPHGPGQIISYVSAHDNWSLWDKLNYTLKETPNFSAKDEQILRANRFAAGIIMTCLGSVFFQAGEEAGRTKQGIGDSYCSPPELNALDWERMYQFEDLIQYYKGMLSIRDRFSVYWRRDKEALSAFRFYDTEKDCVAFSVEACSSADAWKRLWIIYAPEKEGQEEIRIQLPDAKRVLLMDGVKVLEAPYPVENDLLYVKPGAVTILAENW